MSPTWQELNCLPSERDKFQSQLGDVLKYFEKLQGS